MLMPGFALAQNYDNSPIVVLSPTQPAKPVPVQATAPEAKANTATPSADAASAPAEKIARNAAVLPLIPPLPANFPEWAVTNAAQNTAGNTNPVPATPPSPPSPTAPTGIAAEKAPIAPASPPSPESPVSKLWPRDTVPIFVKSCVGFHVELIPACSCVITELMASMPHDEFLKLSESGAIEADPRLKRARYDCVAAPARKD